MSKLVSKKELVEEITTKFRESKTTVFVDYRGLDVAQITELRRNLREAGVDYKVYKNTMTRRALAEVEMEGLDDIIVGPTAVAFSNEDVIAPAKVIHAFAKANDQLEIKGGVIDGELATIEQLKELATLPDYDGLVSMLLSVLQAPMRNLAYATQQIADEKTEQEA